MSKISEYQTEIIRSARKTTRLEVVKGKVLIKTGFHTSESQIRELLDKHKKWIDKRLALQKEEAFLLLGKKYPIEKIYGGRYGYQLRNDSLLCFLSEEDELENIFDGIYCDRQDILMGIIEKCVASFPVKPQEIKIKRLKRTYGNCRKNRKISISLYVLKYSPEFIAMVVYHELCHMLIMNHSPEYYQLLSQYCPDHRQLRKEPRFQGS